MKYRMINCLWLLGCLSFYSWAGVSVMGTRFILYENSQRLNIKLVNDNENDYLIQTSIADNTNNIFVISPPLFVLPKDKANIVTIVPNAIPKTDYDRLYQLSIASIPKSKLDTGASSISLAIRSNFHLIYRHADLKTADFNQLKLSKHNDNKFYLNNESDFVFTVAISKFKDSQEQIRKTLSPHETWLLSTLCQEQANNCNLWVNFIDDDESVIKQLNLFAQK